MGRSWKFAVLITVLALVAIAVVACKGAPGPAGPPGVPGSSGAKVLVECTDPKDPAITTVYTGKQIMFTVRHDGVEVEAPLPSQCGGKTLRGKLAGVVQAKER